MYARFIVKRSSFIKYIPKAQIIQRQKFDTRKYKLLFQQYQFMYLLHPLFCITVVLYILIVVNKSFVSYLIATWVFLFSLIIISSFQILILQTKNTLKIIMKGAISNIDLIRDHIFFSKQMTHICRHILSTYHLLVYN